MPAARDDTAAIEPTPVAKTANGSETASAATPATAASPSSASTPTTTADVVEGNKEEDQYLDLVKEILETGEHRPDRFVCC